MRTLNKKWISHLVVLGMLLGLVCNCTKEQLPVLTTNEVSDITSATSVCGGNITSDGGATIIVRGICWSTNQNPTSADYKTTDGSGAGNFTSSITGLKPSLTYYVRAYAINSAGTAYGNQLTFVTKQELALTTKEISNITSTAAKCGGNITSDGGATITTRGVCWSTSQNPTIADYKTKDSSGTGSFTSIITGLTPSLTYYVRAYAINRVDTAYGSQYTFETDPVIVKDYDGNIYNVVRIGKQLWIKENLRTTHYANGTAIPLVKEINNWNALTETSKAYCWYNDDSTTYAQTYGALYTWVAAMNGASSSSSNPSGIQGACPTGWHLPSDNEWKTLEIYMGMSTSDAEITGLRGTTEGGELKKTGMIYWNSPNTGANNESGFTAIGSGYRGGTGYFDPIGNGGFWWSSTEYLASNAYYRGVYYNSSLINRYNLTKKIGFSVRCVKN